MTDRELMQEALYALTYVGDAKEIYSDTIESLRARLAQPEREWQGLTEMEIMDICNFAKGQNGFFLVREVEAKLKEKNHDKP